MRNSCVNKRLFTRCYWTGGSPNKDDQQDNILDKAGSKLAQPLDPSGLEVLLSCKPPLIQVQLRHNHAIQVIKRHRVLALLAV